MDAEKFEELEKQGMANYDLHYKSDRKKYEEDEVRIRKELALVVREIDPPNNEQAVLYLVGDKDAKVHAEPKMEEPRIFIQVLAGSKEQIEEWESSYED
ncbi:MAG: hypothetical protein EXS52_00190 [Candidatus Staskawiczbacteria bacterium]|nr:hypothetical protein [Candidatus Staskawiczbacteria bacterium]